MKKRNRMNASDIIKAKQNKTLYKAYYTPVVYQSTVFSTVSAYSTFGSQPVNTSYISCINTSYNYLCNPVFMSYETRNNVKDGSIACAGTSLSNLQFVKSNATVYAYNTVYSTFGNPAITVPSSFVTTSINGTSAPDPCIVPLVQFYQGCSVCNGNQTCISCLSRL